MMPYVVQVYKVMQKVCFGVFNFFFFNASNISRTLKLLITEM